MQFNIVDFLSNTFLFSGIPIEKVSDIIKTVEIQICEFKKNDKIFLPLEFEKKLGFVASGECVVERLRSDGTYIPLNTLKKFESFGIMAVLSKKDEFPTAVVSKGYSKVLFISQKSVMSLIESNSQISMNIIDFLAEKVSFLNQKITTFSSDSVIQKFAIYLISRYNVEKSLQLAFSFKRASDSLGCGRASLYRAAASLSDSGIINVENKILNIKNINELERITK